MYIHKVFENMDFVSYSIINDDTATDLIVRAYHLSSGDEVKKLTINTDKRFIPGTRADVEIKRIDIVLEYNNKTIAHEISKIDFRDIGNIIKTLGDEKYSG